MEVMSLGVGQLVRLELSPTSYSPEIEAWDPGRKCGWCRKSWHYHRLAGAKNLMFSSTEYYSCWPSSLSPVPAVTFTKDVKYPR